jgi:DNA-binding response OmpR family regulator
LAPRVFLVVDDEVEIATIIQRMLIRDGSSADTASTLDDAMKLATSREYDFIISDIKMPGGSGIELYRKLSAVKPVYKRRFVFLTGDTSNPATIQFLEDERLPYFPKPFDVQAVHVLLRDAETQVMRD